jgi:predicted nucleotidyltransferase
MNRQIFNEIQSLKRLLLPNERMILFGSQACGNARPDSDWDLFVKHGQITHTHGGTKGLVGKYFILTHIISKEQNKLYERLF